MMMNPVGPAGIRSQIYTPYGNYSDCMQAGGNRISCDPGYSDYYGVTLHGLGDFTADDLGSGTRMLGYGLIALAVLMVVMKGRRRNA